MPIYEYQCRACQATMDIRHGFDETANRPCSSCGGELIRRFNAAGIVFKGSGFYITDSRKSSGSGDQKKTADAASKSSGESAKGDTSTESAGDAKSAGGTSTDKTTAEKSGGEKSSGDSSGSSDSSGSASGASHPTAQQSKKSGDSAA